MVNLVRERCDLFKSVTRLEKTRVEIFSSHAQPMSYRILVEAKPLN